LRALLTLFFLVPRPAAAAALRYFPVGDSYTIGQDIPARDNFPTQLAKALSARRKKITVIANLSRTGWTSRQAIDLELPAFEKARPDFATLLIGVNDWVQGVPLPQFRQNLQVLLDRMAAALPGPQRLLVLSVPDFGASFTGPQFSGGRDISSGIAEVNAVLKEEAAKRGALYADFFGLSQRAKGHQELFAGDGLHPSALQYAQWVQAMLPAAERCLAAP
jgi:lysophospholipase L1-like esterase